jgi:hypothetical protein
VRGYRLYPYLLLHRPTVGGVRRITVTVDGSMATRAERAASALPMLPLPNTRTLAGEQLRGAACVWCAAPLTGESARDLGERPGPDGVTIFPRGCADCVRKEARRVYRLHKRGCERCIRNEEACLDRRALWDLALEGRR